MAQSSDTLGSGPALRAAAPARVGAVRFGAQELAYVLLPAARS